jgi:hypothetical protein
MLKFTKAQIENTRRDFISQDYPQKVAQLDGRCIEYFIAPSGLYIQEGIHIPNGLFRMTGEPQEGYIVAVSDEVPKIIQPHFAVSEHDEFRVYGLEDLDRTIHSERNMIENILKNEPSLKENYAKNKLALYEHMIKHSEGNLDGWGFNQQDFEGFIRAAEFLRGIK